MDRSELLKQKVVEWETWVRKQGLIFDGEEVSVVIRIMMRPLIVRSSGVSYGSIADEDWERIMAIELSDRGKGVVEKLKSSGNVPALWKELDCDHAAIESVNVCFRRAGLPYRLRGSPRGAPGWEKRYRVVNLDFDQR